MVVPVALCTKLELTPRRRRKRLAERLDVFDNALNVAVHDHVLWHAVPSDIIAKKYEHDRDKRACCFVACCVKVGDANLELLKQI